MTLAKLTDVNVDAIKQICIQNCIDIDRDKIAKFVYDNKLYGLFDNDELVVFTKLDFVTNLLKSGLTAQVYVTTPIYNYKYNDDERSEASFTLYNEIETMCRQVGYSEINIKRID